MKRCSVKSSKENSNKSGKTVAFIPVRGGSKSIPLKNIQPFCGKPLVYWTVKAASDCPAIDAVFVATEDQRIREVVEGFSLPKVQVVDRSSESATDEASSELALLEFANQVAFDHVILIQATSPLLEKEDLEAAVAKYFAQEADSLLSVARQKRFIWEMGEESARPVNYNTMSRPRRQDWDGYFVENGALYITSRERLLASNCRISGKIALYEMKEETYFEIDEPSDWVIAEGLKDKIFKENILPQNDSNRINLLISDVDGVLTDAGMYYSEQGDELKKFNTRDGKGLELLRQAGIKIMFLTSESISLVRRRAEKLKADYVFLGVGNKKEFLDKFFLENPEFSFEQTAYIGDDINDLECVKAAYFSATPKDGLPGLKKAAAYTCSLKGGEGCVREICDLILSRRSHG